LPRPDGLVTDEGSDHGEMLGLYEGNPPGAAAPAVMITLEAPPGSRVDALEWSQGRSPPRSNADPDHTTGPGKSFQ
jgi:hypothetical protein